MRTALALVVLVTALVVAGCGGSPGVSHGDDLAAGKALFLQGAPDSPGVPTCAACHTLEDAPGAVGKIGPNLDDGLGPAREQDFALDTFEQVVREQLEIPGVAGDRALATDDPEFRRTAMPSRDDYGFTDDEANDIAFYVATCAGLNYLPEDDPETAAARAICAAVATPPPPAPAPAEPPADAG